jgi:hypothetical protein
VGHWSKCTWEELNDAGLIHGFLAAIHTSKQHSMSSQKDFVKGV